MFRIIKGVNKAAGLCIGSLLACLFIPFGFIAARTGRFTSVTLILAHIPTYMGEYARYVFYKALLQRVGHKVIFRYGVYCEYPEAEIGDHVTIGYYSSLGEVSIGNDVVIGKQVDFLSGLKQHGFSDANIKIRLQPGQREKIHIGSDIWIGSHSKIAADICDRCVIGLSSVVTSPVTERGVYVGNPARKISEL